MKGVAISPTDIEKMRAYRQRGFTQERIGHFLGCDQRTVSKHLNGMPVPAQLRLVGIEMRDRALRHQALIDRMNRQLNEVRV